MYIVQPIYADSEARALSLSLFFLSLFALQILYQITLSSSFYTLPFSSFVSILVHSFIYL